MRTPDAPRLPRWIAAAAALTLTAATAVCVGAGIAERLAPTGWTGRPDPQAPVLQLVLRGGDPVTAPGASWTPLPDGTIQLQVTDSVPHPGRIELIDGTLSVHLDSMDPQAGPHSAIITPPEGGSGPVDRLVLTFPDGTSIDVERADRRAT